MKYVVDIGFGEYVEFDSLQAATEFCNEVADKTKIILSITEQKNAQ